MVFTEYTNNAQNIPVVATFTDTTPTILLKTGEGDLLPETNGRITIEMLDNSQNVIKREVIHYNTRVDDLLSGLTRSVEPCVQNDTASPRERTSLVLDFTPGSGQVVVCSLRYTEKNDQEIKEAITDLQSGAGFVKTTTDQSISGIKTFTSSPQVPTPVNNSDAVNKGYVDDSASSPEALFDRDHFFLGESVQKADSLFPENIPSKSITITVENIGDVAANKRKSVPVIFSGDSSANIEMRLIKTGSPSLALGIRIEGDNNGVPDGQLIDPSLSKSVAAASLTASLTDILVSFVGTVNTNLHGVTLATNETNILGYKGLKFEVYKGCTFTSVTKVAGCTATKCYIYDTNNNLVLSAAFVSNIATFNTGILEIGKTYYVLVGSDGATYTSVKGVGSFPYISDRIKYTAGAYFTGLFTSDSTTYTSYTGGSNVPGTSIINFTPNTNCKIKSIASTVQSGCTSFVLKKGTEILENSSDGVFIGDTLLEAGQAYSIQYYLPGTPSISGHNFPQTKSNITFNSLTGINNPVSITTTPILVENTDVYNISGITTTDGLQLPKGTKGHIVLYSGTYGSENIDPSNYYGIGISTNITNTRGIKSYNTSRGAANVNKFAYIYSTAIENIILAKTSGLYSNTISTTTPFIATESGVYGQQITCITSGLAKDLFSGLTPNVPMYISNTWGLISAIKGTNIGFIGVVSDNTSIVLGEKFNYLFDDNFNIIASDNVRGSSSTVTFTNSTYQNKISITSPVSGTIRLKSVLTVYQQNFTTTNAWITIYKNGSIVVAERQLTGTGNGVETAITYNDDLTCVSGDVFVISVRTTLGNASGYAKIQSSFCYDKNIKVSNGTIVLL